MTQEIKHKILPCIQRKPLVIVMRELYNCTIEAVDRSKIESDAKDMIFNNLSENIVLDLDGSVAERFSLPYRPGLWVFQHGNISDLDFMINRKNETASFEKDQNTNYRVLSDDPNLPKGFVHLFEEEKMLSAKEMRNNIENTVLDLPFMNFDNNLW